MFQIELSITKFINNLSFSQEFLTKFFSFISNNFGRFTYIALVAFILAAYLIYKVIKLDSNHRAIKSAILEFSRFILTLATSSIVTELIKRIIQRGRPFTLDSAIIIREVIDESDKFQSFPSGHTIIAFSVAWFIILGDYPKILKFLTFIVALLVGFSRIYLGVHFVFDILASIIISFVFAKISNTIINYSKKIWIQ